MIPIDWIFEMGRIYLWNGTLLFQLIFSLFTSSNGLNIRLSEVVRLKNPNSEIQGKTYTFEDGREASAFLGIPYAQPPINNLRFRRPLPTGHWTSIKNTTHFGHRCYYSTPQDYGIKPSEDCLFINVFTPLSQFKKPSNLRPIAFYIHGGAFQTDNAQLLGDEGICRYLCSKDVVVITFNYRLQFFGFLTIDENTPGNVGLWDMTAALEWVHENAKVFGGDPNKITVFGQSAGSISTDLFTLSPHTRDFEFAVIDLFNQAIMFAGTKYCTLSVNNISTLRSNALAFAQSAGFKVKPEWPTKEVNVQLLKFFKEASPENITIGWKTMQNFKYFKKNADGIPLISPSYDLDFFPKPLEELRKEAPRKRTITGVTEYEGLLFLIFKPKNVSAFDYIKTFMLDSHFGRQKINSTVSDIILKTFINTSLPEDSIEFYKQCTMTLSDFFFNYATWKMVNVRAGLGEDAYLYYFTYFKNGTLGNLNIPFKAATHTLELPYVFGKSILVYDFIPNKEDKEKIEEFTTYLTNFMKTGYPDGLNSTLTWSPYDPKGQNSYYWFGQDSSKDGMRNNFGADRMLKWQELYKKYGIEN